MRTQHGLVLLSLLAACGGDGAQGPAGPAGPTGPGPTPALSLLVPNTSFPARAVSLQIPGVATHFAKTSTIDFGDAAITVTSVTAGSTALLLAQVQVGAAAKLGAHDVTVTTKGAGAGGADEKVTLKGAFSIGPSLIADSSGNLKNNPQGGFLEFSLSNADSLANPFPQAAGAVSLGGGAKVVGVVSPTSARFAGTALLDATYAVGNATPTITTVNGVGAALTYTLDPADPNLPKVVARAPTALTLGAALATESIAVPAVGRTTSNSLYKFTSPADNHVAVISVNATGFQMQGTTQGIVAGSDGKFSAGQLFLASSNGLTQTGLAYLPKGGDQYLALFNSFLSGGNGTEYGLTVRTGAASSISTKEGSTPDSPGAPVATVTTSAAYSTDGAFETFADTDYVLLKPTKSGRLYVLVSADDFSSGGGMSPQIQFLAADCTTTQPVPPRTVMNELAVTAGTTYCAALRNTNQADRYPRSYKLVVSQEL